MLWVPIAFNLLMWVIYFVSAVWCIYSFFSSTRNWYTETLNQKLIIAICVASCIISSYILITTSVVPFQVSHIGARLRHRRAKFKIVWEAKKKKKFKKFLEIVLHPETKPAIMDVVQEKGMVMKKKTTKKAVYQLKYKDCVGRRCVREYKATCIITVMDEAKKFIRVNHISVARIITPSGKEYYVQKMWRFRRGLQFYYSLWYNLPVR